jgi:hypothetical protein
LSAEKNDLDTRWIDVFYSQENIRHTLSRVTAAVAAFYIINERAKKRII